MNEVVIIPTFQRPELLWLSLERLFASRGVENVDIWVCADDHADKHPPMDEISRVVSKFPVMLCRRFPHGYQGCSYNMLEGIRSAWECGAQRVYVLEDDVLVAPDFFTWHALAPLDCFASVAARHPHGAAPGIGQYWLIRDVCSTYGACFSRTSVERILLHATPAYYSNMQGYVAAHFPTSELEDGFSECDGLITRVMRESGLPVAYPVCPRVQHVGWYGHHRANNWPTGTLEERHAKVEEIVSTPGMLEKLSSDYGDLETLRV